MTDAALLAKILLLLCGMQRDACVKESEDVHKMYCGAEVVAADECYPSARCNKAYVSCVAGVAKEKPQKPKKPNGGE